MRRRTRIHTADGGGDGDGRGGDGGGETHGLHLHTTQHFALVHASVYPQR